MWNTSSGNQSTEGLGLEEGLQASSGNSSSDWDEWLDGWAGFWLEGVALPVVALFGIVGNILCVFVFTKKKMDLKPSFSNILKCLSVFDIIFLMGEIWIYGCVKVMPEYSWNYWIDPILFPYILPITQIALTGSVYSVVAVALERYFNICKPFHRNLGSVWDGLGYVFTIIIFSVLYNSLKFFEFTTEFTECAEVVMSVSDCEDILGISPNSSVATVQYTKLRTDLVYSTVNLITNTAVVGVIPIVVLFWLNSRIIRTMKKNTEIHNKLCSVERRDQAMTALLTGVVMMLVVCHTPKAVMNIYESYQRLVYGDLEHEPLWGRLVIKLSHFLLGLSSAGNILIYSYKDFNFRNILAQECSILQSCSERQEGAPHSRHGSLTEHVPMRQLTGVTTV